MTRSTRRAFLSFIAGGIVAAGVRPALGSKTATASGLGFTPLRLPHPLPLYRTNASWLAAGIDSGRRLPPSGDTGLAEFHVIDDVVVPPEYERYVIVRWGQRVFADPADYVGYNNDYTAYLPIDGARDGLLFVNHEYLSYPFSELAPDTPEGFERGVFAAVIGFSLPPTRDRKFIGESLYNCGASILRVRRRAHAGHYRVVAGDGLNRRLHGLSGLAINRERSDGYANVTRWGELAHQTGNSNFLVATGPAAREVFEAVNADGLGNRIIGTFANCSGAITPWGTVLSAEENIHATTTAFVGVQEGVLPNGSQIGYVAGSAGESFGLLGEKYGWMVEVAPHDASAGARKHTALGRFRHENAALRVAAGAPLVAYLGDDRRGGHIWKFVSSDRVHRIDDVANSTLFTDGTLYVARFNPDGSGQWLPLRLDTPTAPNSPTEISQPQFEREGRRDRDGRVLLPRRPGTPGDAGVGGTTVIDAGNETDRLAFYRNKTLADFYASQGALLCDAFPAANLIGGTPCARPEDIEVHPTTGEVFIAMTDGVAGADGYADARIFVVSKTDPAPEANQPSGGLYKIVEDSADGSGGTFHWQRFAQAGEAGTVDGVGFANVDNLAFDPRGNLWGVTDMPSERHNGIAVGPAPHLLDVRHDVDGSRSASQLVAAFGNNWLFVIPSTGPYAGQVVPFASAPVRSEMTGPTFIDDTLIISVQHPGEDSPIYPDIVAINHDVELLDLDGQTFVQRRTTPAGSQWPANIDGDARRLPRPAVVGIRKRVGRADWEND